MSTNKILLGDEALAQGAIDAGISGCFAYPGTPSTEIMEYFQGSALAAERNIHREWACNEKVAMEEALGMSYAGKRAMVCMKHVGLNVAADGFVNSAVTGTNGGLLVVVADDPSMHSSQNEQDSRFYGQFAMIPTFEPSNQNEAYDLPAKAFAISEKYQTPVLIRMTTRLSHSRANVNIGDTAPQTNLGLAQDARRFILLPGIAKANYQRLCDKQADFLALSENSELNKILDAPDKSLGIIATGIGFNYVMEACGGKPQHPVLKISQYPIPVKQVRQLMDSCEKILVVEEGMPFVEQQLRGPLGNAKILGRLTGELPRTGELNPRLVAQALGLPLPEVAAPSDLVNPRPPRLCDGCPHAFTYQALNEAKAAFPNAKVFGDIGCYTLGAMPPYSAIATCVDMGASISMAKGAANAGLETAIAVIGDSTFTHSGMTGVLDAVWENTPMTIIIVDNFTTGMTGGQDSLGTGKLEDICAGLGVAKEHLRIITPLPKEHDENVRIMKEEFAFRGLSVIISRRVCLQTAKKNLKK